MSGDLIGFTSGFKPIVDSFISTFSGFIPLLILYGLPILIVFIFWKWIWSYIKHFFVGGKLPEGDHITNCDLYANNNGDFVHHYTEWKGNFIKSHSVSSDNIKSDYVDSLFEGRHFKEYADLYKESGDLDYAKSKLRGKYFKEYVALRKQYLN